MKKLIAIAAAAALAANVAALEVTGPPGKEYNSDVNYLQEMYHCAMDGSDRAMRVGAAYERQRNLKITELAMPLPLTSYFTTYATGEAVVSAMKVDRLKLEHPTAGRVYEYLHKRGYTDPVIAGILGNMMAECGGQTLNLDWQLYGGNGAYYGLCMWSLYYGPGVRGAGLDGQLAYLTGNIQQTMDTFGGDHDEFRALQDPGDAARYFCAYYERGAGDEIRAENARTALAWMNG